MSVIKVTKSWESDLQDGLDNRVISVFYQVTFDNADEPSTRPLLASSAYDGTTRIPRKYEKYPSGDRWLYVKNKVVRTKGPFDYEVEVQYGWPDISQNSEGEPSANPLEQEPEVSWTFDVTEEQIDRDINGEPLVNSASHSFDPPITEKFPTLVFHYRRNQRGYDAVFAESYFNRVNSDWFLGFGPGLCLLTVFDGVRNRAAGLIYWTVTIEIKIRKDGWRRRILDEGYMKKTGINSDGTIKEERIKDSNAETVTEKTLLDGHGNVLKSGAPAYWHLFETKYSAPFSGLGI